MKHDNASLKETNRRSILAAVGGAAFAGLPIASAQKPAPNGEEYERLAQMRTENNWDLSTWHHRLRAAGFVVKYTNKKIGGSDVGTTKLDKNESHLFVTYSEGSDANWVNFKWSLNDGYDDWATDPLDYAAITFDSSDYTRNSYYGPTYGDYVFPISDREDDTSDTGLVVEYNSNDAAYDTIGRFESSFDVAVDPSANSTPSQRELTVNFWHTWGAELTDISMSGSNIDLDWDIGLHGGVWNRSASPSEYQMQNGFSDK
ncbi:hypothetical protein [Halosolutus gelatinilyticus]|uniref:hypothetical protein n=1 Tax=Halosolutus gelatinilyticus TaxID=2931975 RepID=UPI001FF2C6D1|nr:hypothetical protein [Halosolutus gelatinilyticus]